MHRVEVADFACPDCGSDVLSRSFALVCSACEQTFPVKGGIVDFRLGREDYYAGFVPRAEMRELNSNFSPQRWNEAVRRFLSLSADKAGAINELVVDGRYAWKIFLDLTPEAKILDLGCGLGNLAKNLAPHVGKLYAMDLTYEHLEFAQNRFATFNAGDDIALLAGDSPRLPFRSDSLDTVVLAKPLEWFAHVEIGAHHEGIRRAPLWKELLSPIGPRNPRRIQLDLLKEIRRVLKPTGQLFVIIENRLNYEYFTGIPDRPSTLPYGALLPRVLANLYSLYRNKVLYRTYTYSQGGYRRLLRDAGFPATEFLGLYKGSGAADAIVPAAGDFKFWKPSKAKNRRQTGWKARVVQLPYLAPKFGIISSAHERASPRLLDKVLDDVAVGLGDDRGTIQVKQFEVSLKNKLILHASHRDQPIFIRLPFNDEALRAEENNHHRLKWLEEHRPALREQLPRALLRGDAARQSFFAESGVAGTSLVDSVRAGRVLVNHVDEALQYLALLNPSCASVSMPFQGAVFEEFVTARIQMLRELLSRDQLARLEGVFRQLLEGAALPLGLMHGDYSTNNLLFEGQRLSGLLDWEDSRTMGIPAVDAISLLVAATRLRRLSSSFVDYVVGFAHREGAYGELLVSMDRYYADTGTDPKHHRGLVYLFWLHVVCHRLRFGLCYDRAAVERYFDGAVGRLSVA